MVLGLAILAAASVAPVTVHGEWGVVDRGVRCDALTRSVQPPPRGRPRAIAGFGFTVRGPWGRFETRLSRIPRAGATVVLRIGAQTFLLASRYDVAWGRDSGQDRAILGAIRLGETMRIDSRDAAGRRFTDSYALAGAPTAIDAAAAKCANLASGQNR